MEHGVQGQWKGVKDDRQRDTTIITDHQSEIRQEGGKQSRHNSLSALIELPVSERHDEVPFSLHIYVKENGNNSPASQPRTFV